MHSSRLSKNWSVLDLRTSVYSKDLNAQELAVLLAMIEMAEGSGEFVNASISGIAAYSKLHKRTVQRVLHGDKRCRNAGLIPRGVLVLVAPARASDYRAATYRLNLEALDECPRMRRMKTNCWEADSNNIDVPAIVGSGPWKSDA